MCGRGNAWQGACVARRGGMRGRGGMCVALGGCAWQEACMAGWCTWQGVCMTGGMHGRVVYMAGGVYGRGSVHGKGCVCGKGVGVSGRRPPPSVDRILDTRL